jgi:putative membrane-bound dehydrogenase-like protein
MTSGFGEPQRRRWGRWCVFAVVSVPLVGIAVTVAPLFGQRIERSRLALPSLTKGQAPAAPAGLPFSVPPGFIAEEVAGPSLLVEHPMFACFDDQGRLYVAGSSGHASGPAELSANPPDCIRRLEDTDGDGRFDSSTIFADKLTFPQGVLYYEGAVYTASPPSLWRLKDTDDDGVADVREELVTGFPFTGIADDLHGPCLGPDGRIYWGVGRFDYQIRVPHGPFIRKGKAPLIMRSRPDGAAVEVFSGAMGNPVEVTFTDEGEPMACGTFLAPDSMGQGLRDAIVHCVPGALYPVRDRVLTEDKRTGEPLPALAHLGVAAASGVMRAQGNQLAGSGETVLYSALFNMHKVERHVLERAGATYRARNEDFVASEDPDFHPTDVLEDADGSLLVVDTGAWFRHCPTSQIIRSSAHGAIYRVRRQDAPKLADPRGLALDWSSCDPKALAAGLDDPRFVVRERAIRALAREGLGALPVLEDVLAHGGTERARRNAVWALCRIDGAKARSATLAALADPSMSVRLAATTAVGLSRDPAAVKPLVELIQNDVAPIRREAASALARIRPASAVPALLESLRASTDRFLDHALIYALIAIADPKQTEPGLADSSPAVRRGALIALDQMDGARLTPNQVLSFLDPSEPALEQAALGVIAHRPAWAAEIIGPLRGALSRHPASARETENLRQTLMAFSSNPGIQDLFADLLRKDATPTESRLLILDVLSRASSVDQERRHTLSEAVRSCLDASDERVVRQAVATVRTLGLYDFDVELVQLAHQPARSTELRVEALEAAAPRLTALDSASFTMLISVLRVDSVPLLRLEAARALAQAPLDGVQLDALTRSVAESEALILPRLLPAFGRSSDARIGGNLIAALERAPGLRSLTPEALRHTLELYSDDVQQRAQNLFKQLEANERERAARLAALEPSLKKGDARQGREVFFGSKATCFTCHSMHGEGARVGPDLSRIGSVRTSRDLLEAILYPSASFARGFEPYVIATHDGQIYNGVIARETADTVYLVNPARAEIAVPRSSIEAIDQARTSIMPQGLEANLNEQELADLVAYLGAQK